jgi:hypothetical protein
LYTNTTGTDNTAIGQGALYTGNGSYNTAVGNGSLYALTSGTFNTAIGWDSGSAITTGAKNTIIGRYSGNQGGLDIRTASNYIVLSDGDGNPRVQINDSGRTQIVGSSAGNPIFIANNNNGSTPDGIGIQFNSVSPNNTSQFVIQFGDSIAYRFRVWSNGNVVNSNNSYGSISDIKLKENVVDASPKLDDLMQVKVRNYNMIGDTAKQIGVVAQELEQVFPSMIDISPDKDLAGNDLGTTSKSVKYSVFVPMLIKAIQEQQALITALTTRITALEQA